LFYKVENKSCGALSPIFVYFKNKNLINKIYGGIYPLETKTPCKYELSEEFGVNRQTIGMVD
jgi:DNA-binding GntR family transcriptional regulator